MLPFNDMYLLLAFIIFVINIIPAFMPATWVILAFFYIKFHLLYLPLLLIGVIFATFGRVLLALISRYWLKKILPKKFYENYNYIGKYLKTHKSISIPIILGYAFMPVSSNVLFIIAGISNLNLRIIASCFIIGRLISYSTMLSLSSYTFHRLESTISHHFISNQTIIGTFLSMFIFIMIGYIKWDKILTLKKKYYRS